MPRQNAPRSLFAEQNLARRIELERGTRGWSYEGLAKRMTDMGCSIQPSALYKIEKGTPPRKITVDELVSLAEVFGLSMAEMLLDPTDMMPARAAELMEKLTLTLISVDALKEAVVDQEAEAEKLSDQLSQLLTEYPGGKDKTIALMDQVRDRIVNYNPDLTALVNAATSKASSKFFKEGGFLK